MPTVASPTPPDAASGPANARSDPCVLSARSTGRTARGRVHAGAFVLVLALATVVRLPLLLTPGYDVRDYKVWAQVLFDRGMQHAYSVSFPPPAPWFNYPPFHLYVLAFTGEVYHWVRPAGDWRDQLLAALLKVAPMVADLALGTLVYRVVRRSGGERGALIASSAYLLNPAIVWNTAYWGGIDAFHALFATAALVLTGASTWLVGPLAALALGSKLLALPELLAILPALARRPNARRLAPIAAGGLVTGLLLSAPILIAGDADRMLAAMFNNLGNTPVVAANAHNFWWLITRGDGWRLDTTKVIGGVSYRAAGLALWALTTLYGLWRQWSREATFEGLMESAAFLGFVFFMFMTEVHENWSFGIFAPLVLAAIARPDLRRLYGALSLTALANMALQDPPLRTWLGPGFDENAWKLGIVNAGVNVALFIWWSARLLRSGTGRRRDGADRAAVAGEQ